MDFISENIIDNVLTDFEQNPQSKEDAFLAFAEWHLPVVQFVESENFKLLKEEEFDQLMFLLLVCFQSISSVEEHIEIPPDLIDKKEEINWQVYNESKDKGFKAIVNMYFEGYPQEDLLAFIEDALIEDEESELSQVGREIIFITCKTYIDICHEII